MLRDVALGKVRRRQGCIWMVLEGGIGRAELRHGAGAGVQS
jgi:hypothetical protein